MTLSQPDHQHLTRIVNWLSESVWNKYAAGIQKHGGHLPDKGGLLHEAECEVLDQAVYIRTLREQLQRIEKWIEDGKTENALVAVGHILRGSTLDRLPED